MLRLIIGTQNSGKSEYAENLIRTMKNADESIGYIATMAVKDEEGIKRINKHRKMREGKGFITFEKTCDLDKLLPQLAENRISIALLECLSNLVGNEMYLSKNKDKTLEELTDIIVTEVLTLGRGLKELVIVSNHFVAKDSFDEQTLDYIKLCDMVNESLKPFCDQVIERE